MITCPLCGNQFDENTSRGGCSGCSKQGCGLIKCPNCQYEFPLELKKSEEGGLLRKILNALRR